MSLSERLAIEDRLRGLEPGGNRFGSGTRPVIRWIKADGLDDVVTKAAIAQATRIFGDQVDYCLCTVGLQADRVRDVLSWANRPVEWLPLTSESNLQLAQILVEAGCPPEAFGYWWKWFPERVRPCAGEWILDGDMVITGRPDWFQAWRDGVDILRVSEDNKETPSRMYGSYADHLEKDCHLYSGLISLPPGLRYMARMAEVLREKPLAQGHDGRRDMCEQGVIASTFHEMRPATIPLYEFPFGRGFETDLDFGLEGDLGRAWGYHFGHAFRARNIHFERLCETGVIDHKTSVGLVDRYRWLAGSGQWGVPGWALSDDMSAEILRRAASFIGHRVLEIGTSRGHLSAMLADLGCHVTTVDWEDRGAARNLADMFVTVVRSEGADFLEQHPEAYDLIIVDLHGNTVAHWERFRDGLMKAVVPGGTLLINNATLYDVAGWEEEIGVKWFIDKLPENWAVEISSTSQPGLAVVRRP